MAEASSIGVIHSYEWAVSERLKVVQVQYKGKRALAPNWAASDYRPPAIDLFKNNQRNIGIITGGGVIDCDLDCDEALFFAKRFLPPTSAKFGRPSSPASHWLYRCNDVPDDIAKNEFSDPTLKRSDDEEERDHSTIIEVRGAGHQTVLPGSTHPSGEIVRWENQDDGTYDAKPHITVVPYDMVRRGALKVGLATLVVRHLWTTGYHNSPTMHLAGMFFRMGWSEDEAKDFIRAVMDQTEDNDKSRIKTVENTYRKAEKGQKTTGATKLREELPDKKNVVDYIQAKCGAAQDEFIEEWNERFAIVAYGNKMRVADFTHPDGMQFLQSDDFIKLNNRDYTVVNGETKPKVRVWLNHPNARSYGGVDFLPGVTEDQVDPRVLNLWRGWATPPKEGDCSAWLELLRDVVCGGDGILYVWMLHWFASIVRDPMEKTGTVPVLIGIEGAGKTMLVRYFGLILGKRQCLQITHEEHIHGHFNKHMAEALLIHSEEALYGGDQKHAALIRSMITDDTHMIEAKGVDVTQMRCFYRLILTSNQMRAAPVAIGDRRYTVVLMEQRSVKKSLVDRVVHEQRNGGPAALHHFLLTMDYDPSLARTNIKNEALMRLKLQNLDQYQSWWYETLETGELLPECLAMYSTPTINQDPWPQIVSIKALGASCQLYMERNNIRRPFNQAAFEDRLNNMIYADRKPRMARQRKRYNGMVADDAPRLAKNLDNRHSSIINLPDLLDCQQAFESHLGQRVEWTKGDDSPRPKKKQQTGYAQRRY